VYKGNSFPIYQILYIANMFQRAPIVEFLEKNVIQVEIIFIGILYCRIFLTCTNNLLILSNSAYFQISNNTDCLCIICLVCTLYMNGWIYVCVRKMV